MPLELDALVGLHVPAESVRLLSAVDLDRRRQHQSLGLRIHEPVLVQRDRDPGQIANRRDQAGRRAEVTRIPGGYDPAVNQLVRHGQVGEESRPIEAGDGEVGQKVHIGRRVAQPKRPENPLAQ